MMNILLPALLLAAGPALAQVTVTRAWVRAPAPGQDIAAAYFTLHSTSADALRGVDASDAGMAMLHQTERKGSESSMEDVDTVPLPAQKDVALAPGGTHVMLMNLRRRPVPGTSMKLTLHFAHAPDQTIEAPVRPLSATGP